MGILFWRKGKENKEKTEKFQEENSMFSVVKDEYENLKKEVVSKKEITPEMLGNFAMDSSDFTKQIESLYSNISKLSKDDSELFKSVLKGDMDDNLVLYDRHKYDDDSEYYLKLYYLSTNISEKKPTANNFDNKQEQREEIFTPEKTL